MAGDGGRVPDVSEQRDISWGANCDRCNVRMNACRASIASAACDDELLCGACRDEERLLRERDEARAAVARLRSDPASVLAALLAKSPEATVAAIEALLTSDEAMGEMENVWVKLGSRDGLFGSVGLLDDASKRRLVAAACRSLLSKAPNDAGESDEGGNQ